MLSAKCLMVLVLEETMVEGSVAEGWPSLW